jgi:hypothetical protein
VAATGARRSDLPGLCQRPGFPGPGGRRVRAMLLAARSPVRSGAHQPAAKSVHATPLTTSGAPPRTLVAERVPARFGRLDPSTYPAARAIASMKPAR